MRFLIKNSGTILKNCLDTYLMGIYFCTFCSHKLAMFLPLKFQHNMSSIKLISLNIIDKVISLSPFVIHFLQFWLAVLFGPK